MRLTCPNCGADYDVPDGMVPAGGRHVQCTSCHTRWFVHGRREPPTEEQVLHRLEGRAGAPRREPPAPPPADAGARANVIALTPRAEASSAAAEPAPEPEPPAAPLRASVSKPAPAPGISRPAGIPDTAPPKRAAPRLDLDASPAEPQPAPPPPRSRFLRGLMIVLVPTLLAFGAYRFGGEIAARVPAAAPALDAYEDFVDDLREDIERRLGDYRPSQAG
jgi:predicted Zn finger-like uncharacterized protein